MKLFGIIENTLVFEDRYSMPVIYVDVSDEDKALHTTAELLEEGAVKFSDWDFITVIPYCMSMNAWKEEYDKLKHRVAYNGDWKVLRILYDKIEGEKEPWEAEIPKVVNANMKRKLYLDSIEDPNSLKLPDEWGKDDLPY